MISPSSTFWQKIWFYFKSNRLAIFSGWLLIVFIMLAITVPFLSSYSYYDVNLSIKNQPPSPNHWFGTDDLGRDIFVRIWYGARISFFVGIAAACIDLVIGALWGGIAALAGGKLDEIMMRFVDILSALPSLLITITLIVALGSGLHTIIIALSVLGWFTMARIVRGQLLKIKQQEYVLAARALGANFWRILFRHLFPNAVGPILVTLTLTIPSAIFTEAFLSYLGLGVQAPIASWGTMANEGLPAMEYYPWRLWVPATFISLTLLAFHIIGDGLNDAITQVTEYRETS